MERNFYFFIAFFLTILISVGSLISLDNTIKLPKVNFVDKILHLSAYFVLTLSWLLAFYKSEKLKIKVNLIIVAVFIYGIIIEVLQGVLTSYRQADLFDIFANLVGIIIAWAFFRGIFFKNRMK